MKGFVIGTVDHRDRVLRADQGAAAVHRVRLVTYEGDLLGIVVISVIFGVVNGLIGPIVRMLALPLSVMTMGLVGFVDQRRPAAADGRDRQAAAFDLTVGDFPPDLLTADTHRRRHRRRGRS